MMMSCFDGGPICQTKWAKAISVSPHSISFELAQIPQNHLNPHNQSSSPKEWSSYISPQLVVVWTFCEHEDKSLSLFVWVDKGSIGPISLLQGTLLQINKTIQTSDNLTKVGLWKISRSSWGKEGAVQWRRANWWYPAGNLSTGPNKTFGDHYGGDDDDDGRQPLNQSFPRFLRRLSQFLGEESSL